ncbi:hypothetical protein [Croceibacter atlanticus]|uniref:hypothetical protein n=1 Tax=Croceibacter atlanticus TaxID=313588 RepID=UPI0024B92DEA|nr:hypothetical protein [Croceibacter atlanticus]
MKYILSFMFVFLSMTLIAQTSINDYKYVVVPKSYEFSQEQDQYQLNSLSKFLFEKHGFNTIMEGDNYPTDLAEDRCLALYANAVGNSGLFVTKVSIELLDCNGDLVYITDEGTSKDKRKGQAYIISTREAFKSLETLNYSYNGEKTSNSNKDSTPKTTDKEIAAKQDIDVNKPKANKAESKIAEEKIEVVKPLGVTKYKRGDSIVSLIKTDGGFELRASNLNNKIIASLLISGQDNVFHYLKDMNTKGIAYFSKNGNLNIEYLDSDNVLVSLSYELQ